MRTLHQPSYNKKYLNLNRRWRAHRPMFVALLKANKILEEGLVSFGPVTMAKIGMVHGIY